MKRFILAFLLFANIAYGAESVLDKNELVKPTGDDILYCIDDPSGTPLDRKCKIENIIRARGIGVQVELFGPTVDVTTGNGKHHLRIPALLNNMVLSGVSANVVTAGTTNSTSVNLSRCAVTTSGNLCSGTVVDMLSTDLTIDSGENDSSSAATAPVVDTANDDVTTGQIVRFDVPTVSTTAPKGLIVHLEFSLP